MAGNYEDGAIKVDYDAAKRQLAEMRTNLDALVSEANNAIDSLNRLQVLVHDSEGSNLLEDYRDLELQYGENGMKQFVNTSDNFIENIEKGIEDYKSVTGG